MTPSFDKHGAPSPEMLAAYADGEFEGRDDLAEPRRRVEDWLECNPDARQELAELRRLRQIWQATTPPEVTEQAWERAAARWKMPLEKSTHWPRRRRSLMSTTRLVAAAVACASLLPLLSWQGSHPIPTSGVSPNLAPLPVAAEGDVEIIRIDGDDVQTVAVGRLPVGGTMEMVSPGDIELTSAEADMAPMMNEPAGVVVIWARSETSEEE